MRPLRAATAHLFWNILLVGQRFAVTVRGNRRERLVIALDQTVGSEAERVVAAELRVVADGALAKIRIVSLERGAVVTRLGVERAPTKNPSLLAELVPNG